VTLYLHLWVVSTPLTCTTPTAAVALLQSLPAEKTGLLQHYKTHSFLPSQQHQQLQLQMLHDLQLPQPVNNYSNVKNLNYAT